MNILMDMLVPSSCTCKTRLCVNWMYSMFKWNILVSKTTACVSLCMPKILHFHFEFSGQCLEVHNNILASILNLKGEAHIMDHFTKSKTVLECVDDLAYYIPCRQTQCKKSQITLLTWWFAWIFLVQQQSHVKTIYMFCNLEFFFSPHEDVFCNKFWHAVIMFSAWATWILFVHTLLSTVQSQHKYCFKKQTTSTLLKNRSDLLVHMYDADKSRNCCGCFTKWFRIFGSVIQHKKATAISIVQHISIPPPRSAFRNWQCSELMLVHLLIWVKSLVLWMSKRRQLMLNGEKGHHNSACMTFS